MCPWPPQETQRWVQKQNNERKRELGTFLNLQHFGGKNASSSFGMGLERTHKWEFKMRSTYVTTKRKQLMQVELKWCSKLSKDNLKHKLSTTFNLWRRHHPPSYNIFCASLWGLHLSLFPGTPKWEFCCPKTLDIHIFSNHIYFENTRAMSYNPQKYLSNDV